MFVNRIERSVMRPGHANHAACRRLCVSARKVANATLYHMRQALFADQPISASQADKLLKRKHKEIYRLLPSAGSQRMTQIVAIAGKAGSRPRRIMPVILKNTARRPKSPAMAKGHAPTS